MEVGVVGVEAVEFRVAGEKLYVGSTARARGYGDHVRADEFVPNAADRDAARERGSKRHEPRALAPIGSEDADVRAPACARTGHDLVHRVAVDVGGSNENPAGERGRVRHE